MTNSPRAFAGHGTQRVVQPVPGQGFQRVSLCLRNRPNRSEKRVPCLNPSQPFCPRIDFPLIPYTNTNSYIFTICFCSPRFMPRRSTGGVNAVSQNCRPFSIYTVAIDSQGLNGGECVIRCSRAHLSTQRQATALKQFGTCRLF